MKVSISNSFASGDLSGCGYGGDNSITITVTKNGPPDVANFPGTHGGYNLSGSGTVCVKGTSGSLPGGSQEQCQSFGSGQAQQPPPPPSNNPPPANTGGGNSQPAPDIPFVGQQNRPGGNWVQAQAEPTYIYAGTATNTQVIAQMHSGWYIGLNGTANGWTQVIVNGHIGYIQDGNGQSLRNVGGSVTVPNPPPNGNGSNPYTAAQQGDGGLNMIVFCGVTGQHESNDGVHAYSWGCGGQSLDKNGICQKVWPDRPYARVVGGLGGFSCHSSVQQQEGPSTVLQPPANNGGSGSTNTGNSNSGSGSNPSSGSGTTGCPPALAGRLQVGGEGRVISSILNLRTGAGTNFPTIITMQKGDIFSVTGNPTCNQGYNWWGVSFLGRSGYAAEGINGVYYAEPSNTPSQPNQPQQPLLASNVVEIPFYYGTFNTTYVFKVDVTDKAHCRIVNGSEIIAQEVNRSRAFFSGVYASEETLSADLSLALYLKNGGYIDNFRVNVETMLLRQAACTHSYYRISDSAAMDLYGLGNVLFGYYSIVVDVNFAKGIGHIDQLVKEGKLDYPDDQSQIIFGRVIASSGNVSSSAIAQSVPAGFISSY